MSEFNSVLLKPALAFYCIRFTLCKNVKNNFHCNLFATFAVAFNKIAILQNRTSDKFSRVHSALFWRAFDGARDDECRQVWRRRRLLSHERVDEDLDDVAGIGRAENVIRIGSHLQKMFKTLEANASSVADVFCWLGHLKMSFYYHTSHRRARR